MKEILENVRDWTIVLLILVGCVFALIALDNNERKNAIARCGSENNLVEKTTTTGETYYQCKVEK